MKVDKDRAILLAGLIVVAALGVVSNIATHDRAYNIGFEDSSKSFRQWLLDVEYAEYDKRTGAWKLVDPTDIQGSLIEPQRRGVFVNIDDHARALEEELAVVRKQQESRDKRKAAVRTKALDVRAL